MSNQVFDFKKQLAVGDSGECDFIRYYKELGPVKSPDRKVDFVLADGRTVELKTDTYDMEKSGNYFMETLSDANSGKIGGPWRALNDKVDLFIYYFVKNKTFFWFETVKLVETLDTVIKESKLKVKRIGNKGWVGEGFAVPRVSIAHIELRKDTF